MKKITYLVIFVLLLLATSCESPMKTKISELAETTGSSFNRNLLKVGGDFSVGYSNGNIQTSQVNLTWTETSEKNFKIYQLMKNNNEIAVFNDVTKTSFVDTLLSENNYYDYQINVFAENGMVAQDTIEVKTAQWDAPSNLNINALSQTDILLTWNDNSDSETGFKIYRSELNTLLDSFVVDPNSTQYLKTGLDTTKTYYFQVVAESQWEEGIVYSSPASINMYDLVLAAPSNLSCQLNSDLSIDLSWNDNANLETGFIIERKINSGDFMEIADLQEANIEEYLDSDTLAYAIGDSLTYRIKAYNDYGNSIEYTGYSNEFDIDVLENSNDLIYVTLTVDSYYSEASWNIVNQQTYNTIFSNDQTFSYPNQQVSIELELEPGWYFVLCQDSYGDGGISGSISQGNTLLESWNSYDYSGSGYYNFYVSNN